MGQWLQRLLGGAKSGMANAATIQGYLRAASQIEQVWQQIDDKVDELIGQGCPPWEAYVRTGYALAFVRACRLNVVFVQELLKADAAANPAETGNLPQITYDQALALCEHIEPYIEEALKAATNPQYMLTTYRLPLELGPQIRDAYQRIPRSHLQGIIGASQEMREWTAGLLAKYELALHAAKLAVPPQVATHLEKMKSEMELGDFHLRTGIDMVGQMSLGQSTDELNARAEGFLWEAMQGFYIVSQLVALSEVPMRPARRSAPARQQDRPSAARQAHPAVEPPPRPIPPMPSAPDMAALFNQVIAGAGPAQKSPVHPAEDVSKLFNQVIADVVHTQETPLQPASDVSALFDQVTASPESKRENTAQYPAEMPDLLKQATNGPAAGHGNAEQPAPKKKPVPRHQPDAPKRIAKDNTQDLLTDICGEQTEP